MSSKVAKNKAARKKQHMQRKIQNRIRRIHYVFATVIKPNWSYSELLRGVVARLGDHHLQYIIEYKYYKELVPYAGEELLERKLLNSTRITSDDEVISKVKVPPSFNPPGRWSYGESYESENYN